MKMIALAAVLGALCANPTAAADDEPSYKLVVTVDGI